MPSKPTTRHSTTSAGWRTGPARRSPSRRRSTGERRDRPAEADPATRDGGPDRARVIADAIAAGPTCHSGTRARDLRPRVLSHLGAQPPPGTGCRAPSAGAAARTPSVGKRTELARYRIPAGERVLYGQRVDGIVRLTDRPEGLASASQRAYLVERDLQTKPELDAVIADYLSQAAKLGEPPMARCPLESYLEAIA